MAIHKLSFVFLYLLAACSAKSEKQFIEKTNIIEQKKQITATSSVSLTNNPPFGRGAYIFDNGIIFDFLEKNADFRQGFEHFGLYNQKLSECSNNNLYCFSNENISAVWPKECYEFKNNSKFQASGQETRIIAKSLAKTLLQAHAVPFERNHHRFFLLTESTPTYVLEYAIPTVGIRAIHRYIGKDHNIESLFKDPVFLAMREDARVKAYPGYSHGLLLGPDPFGACANPEKTAKWGSESE